MKKTQGKAKLNLQYTTKIMRAEAQAAAAAAMKQEELNKLVSKKQATNDQIIVLVRIKQGYILN